MQIFIQITAEILVNLVSRMCSSVCLQRVCAIKQIDNNFCIELVALRFRANKKCSDLKKRFLAAKQKCLLVPSSVFCIVLCLWTSLAVKYAFQNENDSRHRRKVFRFIEVDRVKFVNHIRCSLFFIWITHYTRK